MRPLSDCARTVIRQLLVSAHKNRTGRETYRSVSCLTCYRPVRIMSSMTSEGIALPVVGDRPERARDRIFRVAKDLFYRRGIRAGGVETIFAEAGATKMSLYRSFPSKDELIVAYLQDRDAKYWRWWDKVMDEHPNDPRQQLRDIFTALAARIV